MLGRLVRMLVLCALSATAANAGAWPREKGQSFLAFSQERTDGGNHYSSLYIEYGLTNRTTLGFELGSTPGERSGLVWLQWAPAPGKNGDRWSASVGLGAIDRQGQTHPVGQMAMSWGRGFDSIPLLAAVPGGGWVTVDLRSKISTKLDRTEFNQPGIEGYAIYLTPDASNKVDISVGWNTTPRLKLIGQLRLEHRDDELTSRLAVSAVRDVMGAFQVEIGAIAPLDAEGGTAFKLGFWLEM